MLLMITRVAVLLGHRGGATATRGNKLVFIYLATWGGALHALKSSHKKYEKLI